MSRRIGHAVRVTTGITRLVLSVDAALVVVLELPYERP
jgi:hypothetical protein